MTPSLSLSGYLQILQREAFVPVAYLDGTIKGQSNWSLGFGVGGHKAGDTIEMSEALVRFRKAADERAQYVLAAVKVPISQEWLDGVTSLFYQGGNQKLGPMVDLLNGGWTAAALALWTTPHMATNNAGEYREGLMTRRSARLRSPSRATMAT